MAARPVLGRSAAIGRLVWLGVGGLIGLMFAMYQLVPMWELGKLSTRHSGVALEWATRIHYNPKAIVTFVLPYFYGESAETYGGLFWEDYGYVGIAPILLGLWAIARGGRAPLVLLFAGIAVASFVFVLGPATPFFALAFRFLPGMNLFRFPTRFLVVTDFALCVLGGIGLTHLERDLGRRLRPSLSGGVGPVVLAIAVMNLWWVQPRQNPIGEARAWMSMPATARRIHQDSGLFRVFTLGPSSAHLRAFEASRGGRDLRPLWANRELLSPNSNLLWNLTAAGGYSGLSTRAVVAMWGSPNGYAGVIDRASLHGVIEPSFFRILAMNNVRYLLASGRIKAPEVEDVAVHDAPGVFLHRLREPLARAWLVARGRRVTTTHASVDAILGGEFDARREALVFSDASEDVAPASEADVGVVSLRRYANTEVVLDAEARAPAWLVLSDSYYPGWQATVDGRSVPIVRANINHRAVRLSPGTHRVRFEFKAPAFWLGMKLTAASVVLMALGFVWAARRPRG